MYDRKKAYVEAKESCFNISNEVIKLEKIYLGDEDNENQRK